MTNRRPLESQKFRLLSVLVSTFVFMAGLLVLAVPFLGPFESWFSEGSVSRALALGIGTALISAATIGLGYELGLRRAHIEETFTIAELSTDLTRAGVLGVDQFSNINWKAFFEDNPGDIDICFAYGRTWTYSHAEEVLRIAAKGSKRGLRQVRITLMDPDPKDEEIATFDAYVHRIGLESQSKLQERINESIGEWKRVQAKLEEEGKWVKLVVEGIQGMTPHSFYRSNNAMWVIMTQRQRQKGGGLIPAILCESTGDRDTGLYDWVLEDIEGCRRESVTRTIYPGS